MKLFCRHLFFSMIILTFAAAAQSAHAATIINWGGNYVSSDQHFTYYTPSVPVQGGFSGGDPLLLTPTSGSDYSGGPLYGTVAWTTTGTDGSYGIIDSNNAVDRIEIKRYDTDIQALVLWRQADFLNGLDTGNVTLDATSTATMDIDTFVNFSRGHVVIRLEGGSQDGYYISQEAPFGFDSNQSSRHTVSTGFTDLTWLSYDPATDLATTGSPEDLLTGGAIQHVTEIGFYARSNNASSPNAYRVSSFEVTAVPEPASLALLTLGGLLIARRRKFTA